MVAKLNKEVKLSTRIISFIKRKHPFKFNFLRAKPSFIIIGTMKGGTTYAFNLLCQHHALKMPSEKEIDFFNINYVEGKRWYLSQFPFSRSKKQTGEASPYYLYHPLSAERAYKFNPNLKIIVILRNPTERAISHYNMIKNRIKSQSFVEILQWPEMEIKLQENIENNLKSVKNNYKKIHKDFAFIRNGLYKYQIENWIKYFPRQNFLFIKSETFYKTPKEEINKMCEFIGIEKFDYLDESVDKFESEIKENIPEEIRNSLNKFYNPFNKELEEFLEIKFNWE